MRTGWRPRKEKDRAGKCAHTSALAFQKIPSGGKRGEQGAWGMVHGFSKLAASRATKNALQICYN